MLAFDMTEWNKIAPYAFFLGLIVYSIGMIAFALARGEVLGKFGWFLLADDPENFYHWFFFWVFAAICFILVFLKLLDHRRS
jgi:hypothetical protein